MILGLTIICGYQAYQKKDSAEAQFNLGVIYHLGKGVTPDLNEAIRFFRLAVDLGRHLQASLDLREEAVPP